MRGLFSFDAPLYRDREGNYCSTTLTNQMFVRYFSVVDSLTVVIRVFHLEQSYRDANMEKLDIEKLNIIELPNLISVKGLLIDKCRQIRLLEKYVEEADLIFARMPSVISNMVLDIAYRMKKVVMTEIGGCAWDSYWHHSLRGKLAAPYMYIKEREEIARADFAVYVTESWLQKRYPCRGKAISASNVYLPEHRDDVLRSRIEKGFSIDREIVIGTAAAVNVRYKGQGYMIKAIAKLNEKGYRLIYELVGGGDQTYLKKLAKRYGVSEQIRFKGLLSHEETIKWMDTIDIYAQPSRQEGLPRAVIEAMSRGCITIGSDVAGIPELILPEYLFHSLRIEEICKVIRHVIDLDHYEKIMERNWNFSKKFSQKKIGEKRKMFYLEYAEYVANRIRKK